MIESLVVTLLPLGFLIVLFGGGELFRRRNINMDGDPPIGKVLFLSSKYLIFVLWTATVVHSWGVNLSFLKVPELSRWLALSLWVQDLLCCSLGDLDLEIRFGLDLPRNARN